MPKFSKELQTWVAGLLLKNTKYRNDDYKLIARILYDEAVKHGVYTHAELVALYKYFSNYAKKKYPHPSSIKRIRAKLQEKNPCLQGTAYWRRHNIDQAQVEAELFGRSWTIKEIRF